MDPLVAGSQRSSNAGSIRQELEPQVQSSPQSLDSNQDGSIISSLSEAVGISP